MLEISPESFDKTLLYKVIDELSLLDHE